MTAPTCLPCASAPLGQRHPSPRTGAPRALARGVRNRRILDGARERELLAVQRRAGRAAAPRVDRHPGVMAALLQIEHRRLVRQPQWLAEVLPGLVLEEPARLREVDQPCAIPVARARV